MWYPWFSGSLGHVPAVTLMGGISDQQGGVWRGRWDGSRPSPLSAEDVIQESLLTGPWGDVLWLLKEAVPWWALHGPEPGSQGSDGPAA